MDWKKEAEFQKGQFLGMLPTRDDVLMMAACFGFTTVFIAGYWAFAWVITLTLELFAG
jgi:hypothetical protein